MDQSSKKVGWAFGFETVAIRLVAAGSGGVALALGLPRSMDSIVVPEAAWAMSSKRGRVAAHLLTSEGPCVSVKLHHRGQLIWREPLLPSTCNNTIIRDEARSS